VSYGRKKMCFFFILAPVYILVITYEAILELELYQIVWLEASSITKLFCHPFDLNDHYHE
jgi:hypothetical protein